jgi:hypothetical protein
MLVFAVLMDKSGLTAASGIKGRAPKGMVVVHKSAHQLPIAVISFHSRHGESDSGGVAPDAMLQQLYTSVGNGSSGGKGGASCGSGSSSSNSAGMCSGLMDTAASMGSLMGGAAAAVGRQLPHELHRVIGAIGAPVGRQSVDCTTAAGDAGATADKSQCTGRRRRHRGVCSQSAAGGAIDLR